MPGLFCRHNAEQGHGKGHDSIDKNEELRVFELSYLSGGIDILPGHYFLLENAPSQIGNLQTDKAPRQVDGSLPFIRRLRCLNLFFF